MSVAICKYRNVSERDMDLLFMEAFATDPEFVKLFLQQTEHKENSLMYPRLKILAGLTQQSLMTVSNSHTKISLKIYLGRDPII